MGKTPDESASLKDIDSSSAERIVYVLRTDDHLPEQVEQVNIVVLGQILWRGKWPIIVTTIIFAVLAIVFSLNATKWYRAETLLVAVEDNSAGATPQFGNLSGLASLAGISIRSGDSSVEPIAVLQSREFIRDFIHHLNLAPVFEESAAASWYQDSSEYDLRDAVEFFQENVLRVHLDDNSGLVTVTIEWIDPAVAAEWANLLVMRLNNRLRERSLREAELNISFLREELVGANVIVLQQSIARLLEVEMQKAMLARVNEEFAFRVIDTAEAPKRRFWPKRTQIVMLAVVIGALLSSLFVLVRHVARTNYSTVGNGIETDAVSS